MNIRVEQFEPLLREVGAWQTGHFLLASGMHSHEYIQCQKLLQYPRHGQIFAEALVQQVLAAGHRPNVVVGPALGAVHLELLCAIALERALPSEQAVRAVFAERPQGKFEIRRGVEIQPGDKVLVVEDVTTTGGSAREVVQLVHSLGAEPVSVGAVIDRSGGAAKFDIPFYALVKLNLETYQPDVCPLCKSGQDLVKPGSTKKPG